MAYFKALPHGYVTIQAISYQLLSTKPKMQSHAHPCGICTAQSTNGTGSTPGTPVSSCQLPYLPKGKETLIADDHPHKNTYANGKLIYPNTRQLPKDKMSAKKKRFTINYIYLVHNACQILSTFTNQCHCLHLNSPCLHQPHSHS